MAIDQTLVDILDKTVEALSKLDFEKLAALEQRIVLFAEANANFGIENIEPVRSKKRQLEILLKNCQINLNTLSRLHARNMRNQWAQ